MYRTANGHNYVTFQCKEKTFASQPIFNFKRNSNEKQQISAKTQRKRFLSVIVLNREDKIQLNKLQFGYWKYCFIYSNRFYAPFLLNEKFNSNVENNQITFSRRPPLN